jgi:hypothetical protein
MPDTHTAVVADFIRRWELPALQNGPTISFSSPNCAISLGYPAPNLLDPTTGTMPTSSSVASPSATKARTDKVEELLALWPPLARRARLSRAATFLDDDTFWERLHGINAVTDNLIRVKL